MNYAIAIYALTEKFPREERFGLTAQLRRAAVAIPSNVAEGHPQGTRAYLRHVVIATGSAAECDTQLEIARRLKYVSESDLTVAATGDSVRRLLFGLRRSLRRKLEQSTES